MGHGGDPSSQGFLLVFGAMSASRLRCLRHWRRPLCAPRHRGDPSRATLPLPYLTSRQATTRPWYLERVAGDGNCLIWALFLGLVKAETLPATAWSNALRRAVTVRRCRQALVQKPLNDPLRPKVRDHRTNCIDASSFRHFYVNCHICMRKREHHIPE